MTFKLAISPHGIVSVDGSPLWLESAIISVSSFGRSLEEGDSIPSVAPMTVVLTADDGSRVGYRPGDLFSRTGAEQLSSGQVLETPGVTTSAYQLQLRSTGATIALIPGTMLYVGTDTFYVEESVSVSADNWFLVDVSWWNGEDWYNSVRQPHRANHYEQLPRTIPVTTVPTVWIGRQVDVYRNGEIWWTGKLVANPIVTRSTVTLQIAPMDAGLAVGRTSIDLPPNTTAKLKSMPTVMWAPAYYRPAQRYYLSTYTGVTGNWMTGSAGISLNINDANALASFWPETRHPDANYYALFRYGSNSYRGPWELYIADKGTLSGQTWSNVKISQSDPMYATIAAGSHGIVGLRAEATTGIAAAKSYTLYFPDSYHAPSPTSAFGSDAYLSPIGWALSGSTLSCYNRMSQQAGWLWTTSFGHSDSPAIGILWQRNKRREDDTSIMTCADVGAHISANLADWHPRWETNTETQLMLSTDQPWVHPTAFFISPNAMGYIVRPKASAMDSADASGSCIWRGRIGSYAFWQMPSSLSTMAIPVDWCVHYWVPGQQTIDVNAELSLPQSGQVEITYEEPDGYVMRATAVLSGATQVDSYTWRYNISSVQVDGERCLGFGEWYNHAPCYISTTTTQTMASLGEIAARVIASGDGGSGRACDDLGDGLCLLVESAGLSSILRISAGRLSIGAGFRFSPRETAYSDVLRTIGIICGVNWTSTQSETQGGSIAAVPAGRPVVGEAKYSITDADIIGEPSSAPATVIYSQYEIRFGEDEETVYRFTDWLARDIFGVSETLELDLTPILEPGVVPTKEQLADVVDALQDRYGTARMRWTLTVSAEKLGYGVELGDVIGVTSKYLASPGGGIGVQGHLGRVVSVSYDVQRGTCSLVLLAWARYGAGWNWCAEGTYSGGTFTVSNIWGQTPENARPFYDVVNFKLPVGTAVKMIAIGTNSTSSANNTVVGNVYTGTVSSYGTSTIGLSLSGTPGTTCRYILVLDTPPTSLVGLFTVEDSRLL